MQETSTPERIYTWQEFIDERPKGDVYVRDAVGKLFKGFQCWGCQTCWVYIEDPGGDFEKDRVEQSFPHFLTLEEIPK